MGLFFIIVAAILFVLFLPALIGIAIGLLRLFPMLAFIALLVFVFAAN